MRLNVIITEIGMDTVTIIMGRRLFLARKMHTKQASIIYKILIGRKITPTRQAAMAKKKLFLIFPKKNARMSIMRIAPFRSEFLRLSMDCFMKSA